ncbi:MAG: hypothetical protein V9E83_11460 [Baekduia sp.]
MSSRTHSPLLLTAGVTAALAMIGIGQTTLRGTVFAFDDWPEVAAPLVAEVSMPAPGTPSAVLSGPRVIESRTSGVSVSAGGSAAGEAPGDASTIDPSGRAQPDSARVSSAAGSPGTTDAGKPAPVREGQRPVGAPVAVDSDGDGVSDTWRQGRTGSGAPAAQVEETETTIFSVEPPRILAPAPAPEPVPAAPAEEPAVTPPAEEPAAPTPPAEEPAVTPPAEEPAAPTPPAEEPAVTPPAEEAEANPSDSAPVGETAGAVSPEPAPAPPAEDPAAAAAAPAAAPAPEQPPADPAVQ